MSLVDILIYMSAGISLILGIALLFTMVQPLGYPLIAFGSIVYLWCNPSFFPLRTLLTIPVACILKQ